MTTRGSLVNFSPVEHVTSVIVANSLMKSVASGRVRLVVGATHRPLEICLVGILLVILAEAVASNCVDSLPADSANMEALVGFLTSNLGEQGLPASEAAQRSEEEALGRLVIPAHSPAVVQVVVSLALASSDWRVR